MTDKAIVAPAMERDSKWREYVRRAAERDEGGLAQLYDESSAIVYGLALRILGSPADAEEVAMDVYTQVWRSAGAYAESRGPVLAWLATMARTRAIDRLRLRGPRGRAEQLSMNHNGRSQDERHFENQTIERLDAHRVNDAIAAVPKEQREAVTLAYFSGMSHSEVAEHLGVPVGTVKTRIRLGMSKLRELLRSTQ